MLRFAGRDSRTSDVQSFLILSENIKLFNEKYLLYNREQKDNE
jgi:hypothetical protein